MGFRKSILESMVDKVFNSFFKNKKVLITGHTGFKGSWLSYWLISLGADVSGLSLEPKNKADHYNLLSLSEKMSSNIGDIRDYQFVINVLEKEKPEIIIHLAAQALVLPAYSDPKDTFEVNFNGGLNLLEALRKTNSVKSLVFITSDKCYKNKEWEWGYRESDELGGYDPYSASKGATELLFYSYNESYLKQIGLNAASTRAGNVIGGGDWSESRIIPDLVNSLINNEQIEIRSPNATRPWQHVLEPLRGYLVLAKLLYEKNGNQFIGSYNFGPKISNNVSVHNLVKKGYEMWGLKYNKIKKSEDKRYINFKESKLLFLNWDKAFHYLDWSPLLNFDDTLKYTLDWYKKYNSNNYSVEDITKSQINLFESEILSSYDKSSRR